jgi:site-specific DNA-methyltransferase (cytosine-N4-specific)
VSQPPRPTLVAAGQSAPTLRPSIRQSRLSGTPSGMVEDPIAGLVHSSWSFKDDSTTELTHGMHPYPARMVPRIARKVLETLPQAGGTIWDPFCGSGTVLVEAMIHGFPSTGTDLNPFACLLSRAKTHLTKAREIRPWTDLLVARIRGPAAESARRSYRPNLDDFTLNVERWWKPSAIRDLGFLRQHLDEIASLGAPAPVLDLLDVAFARTVRRASYQRPNQFKRYRVTEDEAKDIRPNVIGTFLQSWDVVSKASAELSAAYAKAPVPRVECVDCSDFVPSQPLDMILTSPPYGDSTTTVAYGQYSSLMMEWLPSLHSDWRAIDKKCVGGNPTQPKAQSRSETMRGVVSAISARDPARAQVVEGFFGDMRSCLQHFYRVTAPSGHLCFVIGDRTVRGVTVPNSDILREDAEDVGFEHVKTFTRRIFFKVSAYRVNPVGRSGRDEDSPAIGKEDIVLLSKS